MTVGAVHHDHIHSRILQGRHPRHGVLAHADSGAHPQTSQLIFTGVGIFHDFKNVLDGDQTFEASQVVHHQQLFNAVLVQQFFGFLKGYAHRSRDQPILGHDFGNLQVQVGFKTKVTVGDNPHQFSTFYHRHSGDAVLCREGNDIRDLLVRVHGHRVHDHAAFGFFDFIHFLSLACNGHVAVNNANAAFARHADGGFRFGHAIHCGAEERHAQRYFASEPGLHIGFVRQHCGIGRNQQDIVKGQCYRDISARCPIHACVSIQFGESPSIALKINPFMASIAKATSRESSGCEANHSDLRCFLTAALPAIRHP